MGLYYYNDGTPTRHTMESIICNANKAVAVKRNDWRAFAEWQFWTNATKIVGTVESIDRRAELVCAV